MPRPLRIEYPGAWYHVMNRGINRMLIFEVDAHREMFLQLLNEISILFQVEIHSYCLMDNHYHILIRTTLANLGRAMRHLNGVYTQRFNRITKRDGGLFRGRYKAILIEAENYLLRVSRYIHLNPVAARITQNAEGFKWSSYRFYLTTAFQEWLHTSHILNFFGSSKNYLEFVSEGVDDELKIFYEKPQIPAILAKDKFSKEKIKNLKNDYKVATFTDINRIKKCIDIETIHKLTAKYFQIELGLLKTVTKSKNYPRMLAIYLARNFSSLTHQKIAEYFTGITRASISTTIKRCAILIKSDIQMKEHYENLIVMLEKHV